MFDTIMPGAEMLLNRNRRPDAERDATELRSNGELTEFTLDELLTDEVVVLWRKPLD